MVEATRKDELNQGSVRSGTFRSSTGTAIRASVVTSLTKTLVTGL